MSWAGAAYAQFRVFSWESFESGQLPATLMMRHDASDANLKIVEYANLSGMPGMVTNITRDELYRFGLRFETKPAKRLLSIMDHLTLDRQLLGTHGKALYQADIFLPQDLSAFPGTAVLAVVNQPEKQGSLYQFYRFGVDSKGNVYFSYAKDTPQPILYKHESIDSLKLERPAWHRFQIIFEGQSRIYCAVDGKVTQFSPIEEPTLRYLNAGIFIAGTLEHESMIAYIDNLSIQYTNEDVPLPDSPWLGAVSGTLLSNITNPVTTVANSAGLPAMARPTGASPAGPGASTTPSPSAASSGTGSSGAGAAPAAAAALNWMTNPDDAWAAASAQNKPLLAVFYAPRVKTFETFQNLLMNNPQSQPMLTKFVLLQLDVNQLRAGTLAQQFNIFKVPAVVVFENGKEVRRFVMRNNSTWADLEAVIK